MGVHGLWRLIEPSGKPVPLETLENKILAVDISIWLHQAIKGFQDSKGATLPNAHLLGIYHRVCKLLYFRIKPVFIFDGGVPFLKKQTIIKRQQQKTKILNEAGNIQTKLLNTLLKHSAVKNVLLDEVLPPKKVRNEDKEDIFKLPECQSSELDTTQDSISSSSSEDESSSPGKHWDLNTVDVTSEQFRSLPADVRHEILTDLIETRKQSSWGRLHELPSHSGEFSQFQMKRLLTRNSVQVSLEEAKQEMGGHTLSLGELEALLTEEGIVEASKNNTSHRIASNENTRYLLMKDIKKEMENALKRENSKIKTNLDIIPEVVTNTDEFEDNLALAIQLSLQNESSTSEEITRKENISSSTQNQPSTSEEIILTDDIDQVISSSVQNEPSTSKDIKLKQNLEDNESSKSEEINSSKSDLDLAIQLSIQEASNYEKSTIKQPIQLSPPQPTTSKPQDYSYLEHFNDEDFMSDSESDGEKSVPRLAQAKTYMMEYSDLTPSEIEKILKNSTSTKPKTRIENEVTPLNNNKTDKKEIEEKPIVIVAEKQIENILSSDSEDSDFIEIPDHLNSSLNQTPKMEIVINPSETIQDDLFSDIFENITSEINKTVVEKNENKIEAKDIVIVKNKPIDIISDKAVENDTVEEEETNIMIAENNTADSMKLIPEAEIAKLTVHELNAMKTNLENEREELLQERNTKERMAANISDQMYQEAQELLELFGVPYVIAPMEAEAQCAFLNEINLTDGTITDDSDIWLFGGRTVYKNFFNHNKHVLEFRSESIEHHFKLTREQMILLALLVGSDYTLGIQGIGPVTALEILASFPPSRHANVNAVLTEDELISGLTEFRKWLHDGKIVGVGRTTLRSKLRNVNISDGFPSLQIVQAYLEPKVETCADQFTWSKPDVVALIDFAREKFGWTKLKSEEILKPVMKKVEDKNIQKSIKDYFATKRKVDTDLENQLSKRVKSAVKKMGQKNDDSNQDEDIPKPKRKPVPPTKSKKQTTTTNEELTSSKPDETVSTGKNIKPKKSKPPSDKVETLKNTRKTIKLPKPEDLHAKEYIPQKERDKINALKNKLKAIEVFRKSKQGPGFMKKRSKINRPLKEEAELSESSASN